MVLFSTMKIESKLLILFGKSTAYLIEFVKIAFIMQACNFIRSRHKTILFNKFYCIRIELIRGNQLFITTRYKVKRTLPIDLLVIRV